MRNHFLATAANFPLHIAAILTSFACCWIRASPPKKSPARKPLPAQLAFLSKPHPFGVHDHGSGRDRVGPPAPVARRQNGSFFNVRAWDGRPRNKATHQSLGSSRPTAERRASSHIRKIQIRTPSPRPGRPISRHGRFFYPRIVPVHHRFGTIAPRMAARRCNSPPFSRGRG